MDEYDEYLAVHVLNEKEIVTYRTLSRALKVHVNIAKQMLWDFHDRTNNQKTGSVHATYLLSGLRKSTNSTSTRTTQSKDGEDTVMASSPPLPGSSMPQIEEDREPLLTRSILLVKEQSLEKARASFVELRSIHVYSLQAEGLNDLQTLTNCTKQLYEKLTTEDPLKENEQYGTIQNAFVKRRSRKTPLAPGATIAASTTKQAPAAAKAEPKAVAKVNTTKSVAAKTASLKRQGSDIMSSFAKNPPKAKPAVKAEEKSEDSPMANISDDEYGDAADVDIDIKEAGGKSKQDRQAELEAMMDAEDEPQGAEKTDEKVVEAEDEDEAMDDAAETPQAAPEEDQKETVTVENGRRRGRRKVMVKKRTKDENGYLVTKDEAVWESFSEDEPAPKKAKTVPPAAKKGGKPGQGNIMSFFGKK